MQFGAGLRKWFLYAAAALLAVSAVLVLVGLLYGGLEPLPRLVQTSALVLGACCIFAWIFMTVWARGEIRLLGAIGLGLTPVVLVLNLLVLLLNEPRATILGRAMASASFTVLALAIVGLLTLARLNADWQERLRSTIMALLVLALLLIYYQLWK